MYQRVVISNHGEPHPLQVTASCPHIVKHSKQFLFACSVVMLRGGQFQAAVRARDALQLLNMMLPGKFPERCAEKQVADVLDKHVALIKVVS